MVPSTLSDNILVKKFIVMVVVLQVVLTCHQNL
jgi:hypothetical protein